MSKLEDLQPGLRLAGVIPGQTVAVIAVQPHGNDAVELTYKSAEGALGQRVLGRDAEAKLSIAQAEARPLNAPAADFKLVAECQRIKLARAVGPDAGRHDVRHPAAASSAAGGLWRAAAAHAAAVLAGR